MPNVLHLSDLHFGYDEDAVSKAQRAESLELLIHEIGKVEDEWKPNILAISGDLSWKGKASGYTELRGWLKAKLFPATGLKPADCIVCPGNHDIDRDAADCLEARTHDAQRADKLLSPERLANGFAAPFAAFAKFAGELGIPAPMLHGKPNFLAGVRGLRGLQFICANSAWFCRSSATDRGELWLGLPQFQAMGLIQEHRYDSAPISVALVHHPGDWLFASDRYTQTDRPAAYAYLAARCHVILSGHEHGAIERASRINDRARLFVGGAAYHNHQYRNNFSLLKIDAGQRTVRRRPWELDPRGPRWEEKAPQEYSLKIDKPGRSSSNPARYIEWLQGNTRSIDLNKLKVDPQKIQLPGIDILFIKLTTASRDFGGGEPAAPAGRPAPVPLEEALRSRRRLVIEGEPGSGKTTFVRWIAWMLCRPGGPPSNLKWLAGFPVWVRISELDRHITRTLERPRKGDPTATADSRWIAHFLSSQKGWGLDEEFFEERFKEENTVLLLDGLDEAANQTRRVDIVKTIQEAARQYGCRIVVTTRPAAHKGRAVLEGFDPASIDGLDAPGIDRFLLQWCRWLKQGDESAAQEYYSGLRPAVAVPGISHLTRNPLMLTLLAVLYGRRLRLPEQRVKLYAEILDWLAEQAVDKHPEYRKDALLDRFGRLALGMQEWKGGMRVSLGIGDAASFLTAKGDSSAPMRGFLELAQSDSGIVTLRGSEIAFWHRAFQEYLAGRTLADLPDTKIPSHARRMLYSAEGREVLPLAAGCLAEGSKGRLALLFEKLTRHALAQRSLARKAHAVGVLGQMLADIAPFEFELSGPAEKQYADLRAEVMAIFKKGEAKARRIPLKTRVDAAEALDQASQARLSTPRKDAYWKTIPAVTYTIGGDPEAYQSLPEKVVSVKKAFEIGRYPVTVWEYERYLDQADLNDAENATPPDWEEQRKHPSRPVVSVTWKNARDYCKWAGCKLPTDAQWEIAARGAEGRIFPWGPGEPDEYLANFNMMVREPTPVGMFPDGDTPAGVSDMSGNVWEWTRSAFDKSTKCVRGASFFYGAIVLRAATRFGYEPDVRNVNLGFRCVRE